ncbi:MAG: hypothetical protein A2583_14490 [Bdellovibrionales bacterium RIFOXYD1_FULL_53_11]|nr:MAG: hypothetical protein A2583_14490 [Bdellovibrionales bacterium RIFOXYD1_FULL_53_11]
MQDFVLGYLSLPFKIEKLDVDAGWRTLRNGRISNLGIVVSWGPARIRLTGPLDIMKSGGGLRGMYSAVYKPLGTVEKISRPETSSSVFELMLSARIFAKELRLESLGLSGTAGKFEWKEPSISIASPVFTAKWENNRADAAFTAKNISVTLDDKRAASVDGIRFSGSSGITFSPLVPGPEARMELTARSGELLWNEIYLSPPLGALPLKATARFTSGKSIPSGIEATIGSARLKAVLPDKLHAPLLVSWSVPATSLKDLQKEVQSLPAMSTLGTLKVLGGTFKSTGSAELRLSPALKLSSGRVQASVTNASLKHPPASIATRGINLGISGRYPGSANASLQIDAVRFRRLRGTLARTSIEVKMPGDGPASFKIPEGIPLSLQKIPLHIGPVTGATTKTGDLLLATSLSIRETPLGVIDEALCTGMKHLPPATFELELPAITGSPASIEPEGSARIRLFDGKIEISDIGIYDLASPLREIDFSAAWDGIRLDGLGGWLNFGEMDGLLAGHARNVTVRAWLPVQYEFRAEARPRKKSDIVFSPEAMMNFVKLFAEDSLDSLPGIVKWGAFGWPRKMLGGYDVDCAGIEVSSLEGVIAVKTLDACDRGSDHYILYSDSWLGTGKFRIQLNGTRYPYLVDAHALNLYVKFMMQYIASLSGGDQKEKDDETPCTAPDEDA